MFKTVSVGIDIGSHSVKIVELLRKGRNTYLTGVVKAGRTPVKDNGSRGGDMQMVAHNIVSRIKPAGIKSNSVTISVPQRSSIMQYATVPIVPDKRQKRTIEFEVSDICEKSGGNVTADYIKLMNDDPDREGDIIMVGLGKNEELLADLSLLEQAKLGIRDYVPVALATANAFTTATETSPDETTMIINIGKEHSDIVLLVGSSIRYSRSVSFGGEAFTESVADALGVGATEAESLKIRKGTCSQNVSDPDMVKMSEALAGAAGQFFQTVSGITRTCEMQTKQKLSTDRIFLTGGGAKLRGLREYLQSSFDRPVEFLDPFGVIEFSGIEESEAEMLRNVPTDLSVAIGLALAGLDRDLPNISLLPVEIKERRDFLQRTFYMYSAVAMMVVFLLVTIVAGFLNKGNREGEREEYQRQLSTLKKETANYADALKQYNEVGGRIDHSIMASSNGKPARLLRITDEITRRMGDEPRISLSKIEGGHIRGGQGIALSEAYRPSVVFEGIVYASTHSQSDKSSPQVYTDFINSLLENVTGIDDLDEEHVSAEDVNPNDYKFRLRIYPDLRD